MEPKKLYKLTSNRMICGVCAGVAEYFNVDANIVRLLIVLLSLFGFSGIILYIIAAVILPEK